MTTLNAEYDYVAILDFLPEEDRQRHQLGTKLEAYIQKNGFVPKLLLCNTRRNFLDALMALARVSKKGDKFLLQLIGHGDPEKIGLFMPDDKVATWKQISAVMQRIHPATISQCVLNMTCCWGLHGIKITDHLAHATSFFGLLGPARPILFTEGYKLNAKIYKKLFAGVQINQIIREINNEFGKEILFGITATGYKDLAAAN